MEIVEENGGEQVSVEIQKVLSSYQILHSNGFTVTENHSIFKIPQILYRQRKKAYVPNGFSFGPWHYGKHHLEATQEIKYKCLETLLHRFSNPTEKLSELEAAVANEEGRIRECYAGLVEWSKEHLVQILVLDGCFIIKMFLYFWKWSRGYTAETCILGSALNFQFLYHDLILLENQVPWFVLEILFNLIKEEYRESLHVLAVDFFKEIFSHDGLSIEEPLLKEEPIEHILDLLRKCMFVSFLTDEKKDKYPFVLSLLGSWFSKCLSQIRQKSINMRRMKKEFMNKKNKRVHEFQALLPSASQLHEAGVKFKRGQSRPMLDVRFRKGVLELPHLLIHETTESLFRNLIAFEQCRLNCPPIVTSYAKLMDNLIDTPQDIQILRKSGVISNSLNPEDAAQFFNQLYSDTYISHLHYREIYWEVYFYCSWWWPRWRSFYVHNYFTKPWAIVSQVFALAILILTILQVVLN